MAYKQIWNDATSHVIEDSYTGTKTIISKKKKKESPANWKVNGLLCLCCVVIKRKPFTYLGKSFYILLLILKKSPFHSEKKKLVLAMPERLSFLL